MDVHLQQQQQIVGRGELRRPAAMGESGSVREEEGKTAAETDSNCSYFIHPLFIIQYFARIGWLPGVLIRCVMDSILPVAAWLRARCS